MKIFLISASRKVKCFTVEYNILVWKMKNELSARIKCPICKNETIPYIKTRDFNRSVTQESFVYRRCPLCRLIFLCPVPSDLPRYYAAEYYTIPSSIGELSSKSELEKYKIEIVQRFVQQGKLVDIGASYGNFVYLAKKAGFLVQATEIDADCCQFMNDTIGVKAICTPDPELVLDHIEAYNVVTFWHVLEHLPNWQNVLHSSVKSLLPQGIIVVALPNPDALQFRLLKRYWWHLDAPRHLQLIPISLLVSYMSSLNMETVLFTTTDNGSLNYTLHSWIMSLRNVIPVRGMGIAGKILTKILEPIETVGLNGSCYLVVFQKRDQRHTI